MTDDERKTLQQVAQDAAITKFKVDQMEKNIATLVTRWEFTPVKLLVYGCTGLMLTGIVSALIALVVSK